MSKWHIVSRHKNFLKGVGGGVVLGMLLLGAVVGFSYLHYGQAWEQLRQGKFNLATFYFERGNYFFGGGAYDLEKAQRNFETALSFENPDNKPILYQLGRLYFIKGDLPMAIKTFDQQLEADPEFKRSYYMRGLTYGYLGDYRQAAEDFKAFLAWKPTSWAAHNDLVWVYFLAGNFEEAEFYAREGLKYNPRNPWLANALGAILLNQEAYQEAREFLEIARAGFATMTEEEWGQAYPGNNPQIYSRGLEATRQSVLDNLTLIDRAITQGL